MRREKKIDRIKRNTRLFSSRGETESRNNPAGLSYQETEKRRGGEFFDVQV